MRIIGFSISSLYENEKDRNYSSVEGQRSSLHKQLRGKDLGWQKRS